MNNPQWSIEDVTNTPGVTAANNPGLYKVLTEWALKFKEIEWVRSQEGKHNKGL
ncbi:MAG: hypothetical protein PHX54_06005 [Lentimicrobiaceae bacterium]|nr:hypothetical protein [Lentimicrobiaceae bacterium]